MSSNDNITFHQSGEKEIYDKALKKLCFIITEAFKQKKKVLIFLSGGSSVNLYAKLADWIAFKKDIGGNLAFAQVDERFQPGKNVAGSKYYVASRLNKNINAEAIRETGLWNVCKDNKIPYFLISQEGSLDEAANGYNKIISDLFDPPTRKSPTRFADSAFVATSAKEAATARRVVRSLDVETFSASADFSSDEAYLKNSRPLGCESFKKYDYKIAVLGIGEDGHTAGLIPGYEKAWNIDRCIVGYNLGQNTAYAVFCQQKFRHRITVTPKLLEKLDYALITARGEKKKETIQNALKKENLKDLNKYPAAIIQKIKEVDIFAD